MYEGRDIAAVCVALVLCLFRPDGIVFAVPLLGYRLGWVAFEGQGRLPYGVWQPCLIFFLVPGLIYFFWRWHYFGELFPLPFLVKSDTKRHLLLFVKSSIDSMLPYLGTLAVALMLVWKTLIRYPRRLSLVSALTLLPTLFYSAMRLDQNNADRFFVYLPVAILATLSLAWREQAWHRCRSTLIVAVAWVVLLAQRMNGSVSDFLGFNQTARGFKQLAVAIHDTLPRGRIIVTEAGLTPYYTDWEAYDAWGLNTREFAERLITADDVRALHPDVVMLHQMREPALPCTARPGATGVEKARTQDNMTDNMIRGIPPGYDTWLLPYLRSRVQTSARQSTQAIPHQCWFVNPAYLGKAGLEKLLRDYGAVPLPAIAR